MPGIAAIISHKGQDPKEILLKMLAWTKPCLVPSHSSVTLHQEKQLVFGANDASSFAKNASETLFVAFEGLLFQTEQLPQAATDAERILLAYERWKEKCFEHLNGQFSIIIFDKEQHELYIARDRMGIRPLYWYRDGHVTLIATSIKALLATGKVSPTVDNAALAAYLSLGFLSQDTTLIQDVNRLLPGYYLKLSLSGKLKIIPFWSYSTSFIRDEFVGTGFTSEIYKEITHALQAALDIRVMTSRRPCASLGSELGSYMLWNSLKGKREPSDVPRLDFRYTQESTASKTDISAQDFLNSLVPIVWAQEQPIAEVESVRSYYFAKRCHSENWDTLFDSGFAIEFENYAKHTLVSKAPTPHPERSFLWRCLFLLFPSYALKSLRKSQTAKPQVAFFEYHALLQEKERKRASPHTFGLFDLNLFVHDFYNLARMPTLYASLFYLNVKTRLIDSISESRLRLTQNFDVMGYSPFMNYQLLDFFASLNPEVWASPDILPLFPPNWLHEHEVTLAALGLPIEPELPISWLKTKEIDALHKALLSGLLVESGYVSHAWLKSLSKRHPEAYLRKLYAIAVLEVWMRLFIDLPIRESTMELRLPDLLKMPT